MRSRRVPVARCDIGSHDGNALGETIAFNILHSQRRKLRLDLDQSDKRILHTRSHAQPGHANTCPGVEHGFASSKTGARDLRRSISFRIWNQRACRLANALLGLGLGKGDRIAVLAYNCVEWMEINAATARAGLVAVPINFRLLGEDIFYILEDCAAGALIVRGGFTAGWEGPLPSALLPAALPGLRWALLAEDVAPAPTTS